VNLRPLGRDEVRKAIRFASPRRPPTSSVLPATAALEQRHGARLESLRSLCPDDVVSLNITIDYWNAPPDDPDYRFALRGAERPPGVALDAEPVIARWTDLDRFIGEFPTAWREEPMRRVAALRSRYPDRYLLVSFGHYFVQRLASLRGASDFLADLHLHPRELHVVMDKLLDLYTTWAARVKEAGADGVHGGDDLGTQRSLFFAPVMFRELLLPYYRALAEALHARGLDFWLHSCGDITEILGDLVDCGVDVIHPIQVGAMEQEPVSRLYGGRIAFHLGMDVQDLIPRGPPDRIRSEILRRVRLFHRGDGGTILGAGNVFTEDVPIEHIEAYVGALVESLGALAGPAGPADGR
jgi:uroporphyrinogen decarboxylase